MNNNLNLKKPKSKLRKLNSVVALVGVATVATIGSLFYIVFKAAKPKDTIIKKTRNKRK